MATDNKLKIIQLIDAQNKEVIHASSLRHFELAGWESFGHPDYTLATPLELSEGVETLVTFPSEDLTTYPQFSRRPSIGATKYPLWDFTDNKFRAHKQNPYANFTVRIQGIVRTKSATAKSAIEAVVRNPSIAILREQRPLIKSNDWQRATAQLDFYWTPEDIEDGFTLSINAIGDDLELRDLNLLIKSW